MNLRTRNMIGHDLVTAKLVVGNGTKQLHLLVSQERVDQLFKSIDGSLNCNPNAPSWLFELSDLINPVEVPTRFVRDDRAVVTP